MARVAFLVADGYEDSELDVPLDRLRREGHEAVVVGPTPGAEVRGWRQTSRAPVELGVPGARAEDFDALVVPGGWSPDRLRTIPAAVALVQAFADHDEPIAAIGHAGSLLIEAGVVQGMRLTSWPSIRLDLIHAGARWEDRDVVEDGRLITSRRPEDLEAFCRAILGRLESLVAR